ncbi:MAG: hypothetical protein ABH956_03010, partial [Candidatus Nealsonbacteria bacterium]
KTKIIPVRVEGTANMRPSQFFLRKYKVKVKVGKVFCLHCAYTRKIKKPEDLNEATEKIMEKIREL